MNSFHLWRVLLALALILAPACATPPQFTPEEQRDLKAFINAKIAIDKEAAARYNSSVTADEDEVVPSETAAPVVKPEEFTDEEWSQIVKGRQAKADAEAKKAHDAAIARNRERAEKRVHSQKAASSPYDTVDADEPIPSETAAPVVKPEEFTDEEWSQIVKGRQAKADAEAKKAHDAAVARNKERAQKRAAPLKGALIYLLKEDKEVQDAVPKN